MAEKLTDSNLLGLTAQIVSAHVSNNPVEPDVLPSFIRNVYKTLAHIGQEPTAPAEKQQPAVPVRKSVFPDYIICLEDGKRLKMLKRHLAASFNLTPEQYREKWGLESGLSRWWRRTMPRSARPSRSRSGSARGAFPATEPLPGAPRPGVPRAA